MTAVATTSPPSSAPPPPKDTLSSEVERIFTRHSPETFFVESRVLRRVLRNELEITSPLIRLPHRKVFVIDRDRLLWLVARDELGVEPHSVLPARLILIARPDEDELSSFDRERLLLYYWQLAFHGRLDFHLHDSTAPSRMSTALLRERINSIGQTEFDEIRSVLRQESMLLKPNDQRAVYAEFVAVYFELEVFAQNLLTTYFPSLRDHAAVRDVITQDCQVEELYRTATPPELATEQPSSLLASEPPLPAESKIARERGKPSEWRCRQRMRWAARFQDQGNVVRSALYYQQAALVAPPELVDQARQGVATELDALVHRLQAALELTDELAAKWRQIAGELAAQADLGFWNANVRLLYDLQKVCLDHERETYRVDLWKWLRSFGGEPLRRPLPNQRLVLMSKHLYTATRRLGSVQLSDQARSELSHLLHESATAAERLLRRRLEPFLAHSLVDTGFVAQSVVEEVAFDKVVQELLDRIVHRGFITLGDLRDTVSRNQLKMPDLADTQEFFSGDALLRADQRFAFLLDGVYQRGPFYLRWLQRLSSLLFGTAWGRNLTLYALLPYGGAFMAIRGIEHLVVMFQSATGQTSGEHSQTGTAESTETSAEPQSASDETPASAVTPDRGDDAISAAEDAPELAIDAQPGAGAGFLSPDLSHAEHHSLLDNNQLIGLVALLGTFILVLIHFPRARDVLLQVVQITWKILRRTLYDWPLAVLKFPPVAWLLRSLPVMLFRRYLLTPLVLTALYARILPWIGLTRMPANWQVFIFFALTVGVFLSRLGRDTEELFWDWVGRTWYRVRVHLIVGLFTLIVDVFRQIMDGLERVLYAVDEWLRFRTGESHITLAIKAVLGAAWAVVHAVIRFAVTLLIEPQINPIKHFPVVTVSHKLLLPLVLTKSPSTIASPLASLILVVFKDLPIQTANTIAATVVFGIPGIFGFLVWEFKENWKLYSANRSAKLRPVRIGSHGETMLRLLSPGFHSGTIPKLYAKLRRNARKSRFHPERDRRAKFEEQLHHVAESVRHFVDREFLALLRHTRALAGEPLEIADVRLSTNRLVIEIAFASQESRVKSQEPEPEQEQEAVGEIPAGSRLLTLDSRLSSRLSPLVITISEQSGFLIAGITEFGWVHEHLDDRQRRVLQAALAGLYLLGGANLVREQIEDRFGDAHLAYDIAEPGLVVWPRREFDREVVYPLNERPISIPRPRSAARTAGLQPLPLADLVFSEHRVAWEDWQRYWQQEQTASSVGDLLELRLLPVKSTMSSRFQ